MLKTCLMCGKSFITQRNSQHYTCISCSLKIEQCAQQMGAKQTLPWSPDMKKRWDRALRDPEGISRLAALLVKRKRLTNAEIPPQEKQKRRIS